MKLLNSTAWRYEIRGAGNRLVQMRRGFATEKAARQSGERAKKRLIQSVACTEAVEKLTLVALNDAGRKAAASWKPKRVRKLLA
jgi:hypothetical protein